MDKPKSLGRSRARHPPSTPKHSQKTSPASTPEIDQRLYQKFVNFLTRTKLQKLKEKLTYFYGRNFPIKYQEKFAFVEEWQGGDRSEEKNLSERI